MKKNKDDFHLFFYYIKSHFNENESYLYVKGIIQFPISVKKKWVGISEKHISSHT